MMLYEFRAELDFMGVQRSWWFKQCHHLHISKTKFEICFFGILLKQYIVNLSYLEFAISGILCNRNIAEGGEGTIQK